MNILRMLKKKQLYPKPSILFSHHTTKQNLNLLIKIYDQINYFKLPLYYLALCLYVQFHFHKIVDIHLIFILRYSMLKFSYNLGELFNQQAII